MAKRIGPFSVVKSLVHTPQLRLVEARDADDGRVLLQIAPSPVFPESAEDIAAVERRAAQQTARLLVEDPGLGIRAHGAADTAHSGRVLFWALDFPEDRIWGPSLLEDDLTNARVLEIGIALAERLLTRHESGLCDPLLCETLLAIGGQKIDVLGVPVFVGGDSSRTLPRLAPEESVERLTPRGDLYRLGRVLEALCGRVSFPDPHVLDVIRSLTAVNGHRRIPDAASAAQRMRQILRSSPARG